LKRGGTMAYVSEKDSEQLRPPRPNRPKDPRFSLFHDAREAHEWVRAERAKSPISNHINEKDRMSES
jgi:hypothetical protein